MLGPYKGTVEPQAASIAAAATPEAIRAKREVRIGVSLLFYESGAADGSPHVIIRVKV